ncbi:hypothetical protein KA005_12200 [bacterium]|nr:hypothetical protein [bacterium]
MKFRDFKEKVKKMPLFSSDVAEILSVSPKTLRNQLARWKKQGLLVDLKRGLYALCNSERQTTLSREVVASNIYQPSYLSLETALSAYRLIPEKVKAVTSVTTKKTRIFHNNEGVFIYHNLKTSLYFGFVLEKDESGFPYFIAEPEKALLDYLYLNLGKIDPLDQKFFNESLRLQNRSVINKRKLVKYAKRFKTKKLDRILEKF